MVSKYREVLYLVLAVGGAFVVALAPRVFGYRPPAGIPTRIGFNASPNPVAVGESVGIFGSITRTDTGNAVLTPGLAIDIILNGQKVGSALTNAQGTFSATITAPSTQGTYTLRADFLGGQGFAPSSSSQSLTVTAPPPPSEVQFTVVVDAASQCHSQNFQFDFAFYPYGTVVQTVLGMHQLGSPITPVSCDPLFGTPHGHNATMVVEEGTAIVTGYPPGPGDVDIRSIGTVRLRVTITNL